MLDAGVIGIARVVMHSKERLAALVPSGAVLVLNTIRWASETRPATDLKFKLPAAGRAVAGLKTRELKMVEHLISDMTGPWKADAYTDQFGDAIQARVNGKLAAGETQTVAPLGDAPAAAGSSNVANLTELLARSLAKRKQGPGDVKASGPASVESRKGASNVSTRERA